MIEPGMVRGTATPGRRSDPVVPLTGESFGQQDATARRELCERNHLLAPDAVDRECRGPARTVIFHQGDVQSLTGAEAAQSQSKVLRARDRFLSGLDARLDHERRRVVRGTPAARVDGQLEVEDGLAG